MDYFKKLQKYLKNAITYLLNYWWNCW